MDLTEEKHFFHSLTNQRPPAKVHAVDVNANLMGISMRGSFISTNNSRFDLHGFVEFDQSWVSHPSWFQLVEVMGLKNDAD